MMGYLRKESKISCDFCLAEKQLITIMEFKGIDKF